MFFKEFKIDYKTIPGKKGMSPPYLGIRPFFRGGGWGVYLQVPRSKNFVPSPLSYCSIKNNNRQISFPGGN